MNYPRTTPTMLALAALLSLSPKRARGESQSAASGSEAVVVTGTRTPESAQRATVRTDVVTREDAERRGATNVSEALQSQPGVQVNPGAYGYLGNVSAIQIQGFDRERVLVLEDGERVVGDIGGAIDLSTLPIADLARIEIVTGPSSSLYGASAIGGVVNVVTSPPSAEGFSGRARLEGRSQRGLVFQGNGAYRSGTTWAGLDLNLTRQDGVARIEGLPDLQIPETNRRMIGVRAGTSLGKRVDFRVRARWFHDNVDGLESTLAPGLGRYVTDLPEKTNRYTLHAIESIDLGSGSSLRVTLGRQWVDGESATSRRNSPLGELRERYHRMQSLEAVATFADGDRTWVVGSRFEVEHFTQDLTKTESTSSGLTTTRLVEVEPETLGSGAVYGQLKWKLGEKLTVLPGVRGELHTRYGGALAPRLAFAYQASPKLVLRASGGRGFRAPSAKELGFVFDHSIYGYRVMGNSDLKPETSWGVNSDIAWQPDPALSLRASAFMNWVDELIDVDLAAGVTTDGVATYTYRNFGKARTVGAQADAGWKVTSRLKLEASYAYLYTRDDTNDQPLGGRPPHTVTASVLAKVFFDIEAYARFRVVSDAFLTADARTPGYSTLDLRIGRELWPKSQGYLGALNVADVHQEAGRIGDTRPPMGRVLYIGVRAEFPWEQE